MKLKYQITYYREVTQEELTDNNCENITQYADQIQQLLNVGMLSIVDEVQESANIDQMLVQGIED